MPLLRSSEPALRMTLAGAGAVADSQRVAPRLSAVATVSPMRRALIVLLTRRARVGGQADVRSTAGSASATWRRGGLKAVGAVGPQSP